jgi:hypothetical protein
VKNPFEFRIDRNVLPFFTTPVITPAELFVVLNQTRAKAKKKGRPCSLTRRDAEELWKSQRGLCALCLLPFSDECEGTSLVRPLWPSFDRITPADGYHRQNVRLTHAQCNMARGQWGDERLVAMCRAIIAAMDSGAGGRP